MTNKSANRAQACARRGSSGRNKSTVGLTHKNGLNPDRDFPLLKRKPICSPIFVTKTDQIRIRGEAQSSASGAVQMKSKTEQAQALIESQAQAHNLMTVPMLSKALGWRESEVKQQIEALQLKPRCQLSVGHTRADGFKAEVLASLKSKGRPLPVPRMLWINQTEEGEAVQDEAAS